MENKQLIFTKIPLIMSKVWVIWKDRKNDQQWYKFRWIDDMYNALNQHLSDEKVFFTSEILSSSREERATKSGWVLTYSIITMKFTAYAEDWSNVSSTTVGEAMDSWDKSMNKAMSTAYKYALMQIFCIPTEDEKDTEVNTHEVAPKTTNTITNTKWELHSCTKCWKESVAEVFEWKYWPCFKCEHCNWYSKPNLVKTNTDWATDLSNIPF